MCWIPDTCRKENGRGKEAMLISIFHCGRDMETSVFWRASFVQELIGVPETYRRKLQVWLFYQEFPTADKSSLKLKCSVMVTQEPLAALYPRQYNRPRQCGDGCSQARILKHLPPPQTQHAEGVQIPSADAGNKRKWAHRQMDRSVQCVA